MNIKVVPGILEKDLEEIKKKVSQVSPYVDEIQIDLCDGKLVPNSNFSDPLAFSEIIKGEKKFGLHMMVSEPGEIVEDWVEVGFKRVVAHVEGITEPLSFLHKVKSLGVEVGLGIDFNTRLGAVEQYLDYLDFVLVMAVEAGFSGRNFGEQALEKVRKLRGLRPNLEIEVDGGINLETAKLAKEAGASSIVSTSYIFNGDVGKNIERLKNA